jgi:hypothetical protein
MKIMMKKFISISWIAVLAFFLMSCSKDDDDTGTMAGDYYFRFKLNGQQMDYTDPKIGHNLSGSFNLVDSEGIYTTSAVAMKTYPTINKNTLSIVLAHPAEFQTGIDYTNFDASGNVVTQVFVLGYYDANSVFYHAEVYSISLFGGETDAKVRFSELTSTNMKGTFSGTLYDQSGSVKVTQGEFNVPRNQ